MADLSFLDSSFQHLPLWLESIADLPGKTLHIVHCVFFASKEAREAYLRDILTRYPNAVKSYEDELSEDDYPFWLEVMDPADASFGAIRQHVTVAVDLAAHHKADYNDFKIHMESPTLSYLLDPIDIDPDDYTLASNDSDDDENPDA